MTRADLAVRLERCADEMERGIAEFRARHERGETYAPGVVAEALLDATGRPILAGMYAQLAETYVALERLSRTEP